MFDGDLLSERARVTPDKTALVSIETGQRLTYADLNARAERAAATLRTVLEPGERFGLLALNSIEFVELFFAAGRAGVIVVPLSTRATAHELGVIARDCEMKVLFYGPEHADIARELLSVVGCQLSGMLRLVGK
jgi:acyl-CoA synthetase (AMP-forming)/AMP-acid ligase II